jgi:Poly(R)-hydroxyalkanoic acid synthase subunit (PHA_synth_III_E)
MSAWKLWKQMFDAWEGATADYLEQVLRSPLVLEPGGAWLTGLMKLKAGSDELAARWWGSLGLPTKRDQERTLHLLNQLHSRVLDLEERLADAQRR